MNDSILPPDYFGDSICGTSPKSFMDDIGDCVLRRVRKLTTFLFNKSVVCERLCKVLVTYLKKLGLRPKRSRKPTKSTSHSVAMDATRRFLSAMPVRPDVQGLSWNLRSPPENENACLGDLFLLYRTLVQGPATQFLKRSQIRSLGEISTVCIEGSAAVLSTMVDDTPITDATTQESIVISSRILRAGLLSAVELEFFNPGLLRFLGTVLHDVQICVQRFYDFYDRRCSSSAGVYAASSEEKGFNALRKKYLGIPLARTLEGGVGNCYAAACRTGCFFPGRPQVRPFPFNDEMRDSAQSDPFGICSKHYLQKNKTFTPGALTYCCSCSSPITLGFKVLGKNEGPRAVLDVLVSRFPEMPGHIIYDFGCGLYSTAVHTLWWAMANTTIISDAFHALNHKCSPSFFPSAHVSVNMTNTVSHEQRNRSIAEISKSLRSMSQEFYVALLAYQVSIMNLKAKAKNSTNYENRGTDTNEHDLGWAFFHCLGYSCTCCT